MTDNYDDPNVIKDELYWRLKSIDARIAEGPGVVAAENERDELARFLEEDPKNAETVGGNPVKSENSG